MKAAVMHAVNQPLVIEDLPEPVLDYGEVLVATNLAAYAGPICTLLMGRDTSPNSPIF